MSREFLAEYREVFARSCVAVVLLLGLAGPIAAQSGVEIGTGENLLHLLNNNGDIAVDFNVDDVSAGQSIVIGRADTTGLQESDIDVIIVDSESAISTFEQVIRLDNNTGQLILGSGSSTTPGEDGDLTIEDGDGNVLIDIDGNTGNINQDIDNSGTQTDFFGNGAVKAWARIDDDGSIDSCWKCNTDTAQTRNISTGTYEVDFTLGSIQNRPLVISMGEPYPSTIFGQVSVTQKSGSVQPRDGDSSSVYVRITDAAAAASNDAFTVFVF